MTSSVETAVQDPKEAPFIEAIAAQLWEDGPKIAYADWLEQRGDARAKFVRDLIAAYHSFDLSDLSNAEEFPRAWTNMLGVALLAGIIEQEAQEFSEFYLRLTRPMIIIETEPIDDSEIEVGQSKFGGLPDLPADVEWPDFHAGRPAFIGQINLAELQETQCARLLPADGLLSFFASDNDGEQPGMFPSGEEEGSTRVIYTPAGVRLARRNPPDDHAERGCTIYPACRLAMCEAWDLSWYQDIVPGVDWADLDEMSEDERIEKLWFMRDSLYADARVGNHLMGYSSHNRGDDPTPGPDWQTLLCLDSDENLGWNWCDGEHLSIFAHNDDIRAGKFERVFGSAS